MYNIMSNIILLIISTLLPNAIFVHLDCIKKNSNIKTFLFPETRDALKKVSIDKSIENL